PVDVRIHVTSGAGVDIRWSDGHASHYEFTYLRDWCPCATCNDERYKKAAMAAPAPGASGVLPMFKPKPRAQSAKSVGNYSIQISTSYRYTTVILSPDHPRSICPAAEVAELSRAAAG